MLIAMAVTTKIYALVDPTTEEVRYIGQTKSQLYDRLKVHIHQSRYKPKNRNFTHKEAWINGLLNRELRPKIELLELVSGNDSWPEREKWWIAHYRECGNLTNLSDGGESSRAGLTISEAHKSTIREAMFGNKYSLGHKWTVEQREKMMESRTGRKMSRPGSSSSRAKLCNSDVLEIRRRVHAGEKQGVLAIEYCLHHSTLQAIVSNRSWRHLPCVL